MERGRQDLESAVRADVPEERQQAPFLEAGQKRPDRVPERIRGPDTRDALQERIPGAHGQVCVGREDAEQRRLFRAITRHLSEDAACPAGRMAARRGP